MRDPKRIKPMLNLIEEIWIKAPDLRLMQLLLNAIGSSTIINTKQKFSVKVYDHYNTEDHYVLEQLQKTYKKILKDDELKEDDLQDTNR